MTTSTSGRTSDAPAAAAPALLDDLRSRLRATRRTPLRSGHGWSHGVDPDYLADLLAYWAAGYDWQVHEAELRSLPWARTGDDASGLRCVHAPVHDRAPTVVLLHGWPDSFARYARVLPLLADVNVVVPCLPGFPYALPGPGMAPAQMADLVATAMAELGYGRYVVSGGDIGSVVADAMAANHPERVAALHLTNIPPSRAAAVDPTDLDTEEQQYLAEWRAWQFAEGAFAREQATKPDTLAVALSDSPAGLAAWIVEKLHGWSDCRGDVESVWSRDELLTWITLYWVTGAIGTSFAPYHLLQGPGPSSVDVPAFFQTFAHDNARPPRRFAERFYDVRDWDRQPDGGHFGPWERPEAFAAGLGRAALFASDGVGGPSRRGVPGRGSRSRAGR